MGLFDKLKAKRSERDNGVSPVQGSILGLRIATPRLENKSIVSADLRFLREIVRDTPQIMVNGDFLRLDIPGATEIPFISKDEGRAFRLGALSTTTVSDGRVRLFAGFPAVCVKCGKPSKSFVPMVGFRSFGAASTRSYLQGSGLDEQTTQRIFYLLYHEQELIALPTCGACDVKRDILFGYERMSSINYVQGDNYQTNFFYTTDRQTAAILQANGFRVDEVLIHDGREARPPSQPFTSMPANVSTQASPPVDAVDASLIDARSRLNELDETMKVVKDPNTSYGDKLRLEITVFSQVDKVYACLERIDSEDDLIALFDELVAIFCPYESLKGHRDQHLYVFSLMLLLRKKAADMPHMAEHVCERITQEHPANIFYAVMARNVPYWEYDSFDFTQLVNCLPVTYDRAKPTETWEELLLQLYEHRPDLRQQILSLDGVELWAGDVSEHMAPIVIHVDELDETSVKVKIPDNYHRT
jgi:hypothetical protein